MQACRKSVSLDSTWPSAWALASCQSEYGVRAELPCRIALATTIRVVPEATPVLTRPILRRNENALGW